MSLVRRGELGQGHVLSEGATPLSATDEVATDVTVVFADVTGSTSLGEQRDPGA
jgi:class 3 adenylate cyclase